MAEFSGLLILIGAGFLGYVFSDLLKELGLGETKAYSFGTVLGLGVLAFLAYWWQPFFIFGRIQAVPLSGFYGTDYFNFTIALMIGNGARLVERLIRFKKTPKLY